MAKEEHKYKEDHKAEHAGHVKTPEGGLERIKRNPLLLAALAALIIVGIVAGSAYLYVLQQRVYIERAEITAPLIAVAPSVPGVLDKVLVSEGDVVGTSRTLAIVDGQELHATTHGTVVSINNVPGQIVSSQNPVLKMIDDRELRLVGQVDEDKGLTDILPGQRVVFTVDAFGSRQFTGVVDHVRPTAHESDIVFSISDQREVRQFDVVARFNVDNYPELKNGMSAKMWVYK